MSRLSETNRLGLHPLNFLQEFSLRNTVSYTYVLEGVYGPMCYVVVGISIIPQYIVGEYYLSYSRRVL